MNTFDWLAIALLACLLVSIAATMIWWTSVMTQRIVQLENQLTIFVQTSIEVARSVDRLTTPDDVNGVKNVSSRRWVLDEAKQRLQKGDALGQVSQALKLKKEEYTLLKFNQQLGSPEAATAQSA